MSIFGLGNVMSLSHEVLGKQDNFKRNENSLFFFYLIVSQVVISIQQVKEQCSRLRTLVHLVRRDDKGSRVNVSVTMDQQLRGLSDRTAPRLCGRAGRRLSEALKGRLGRLMEDGPCPLFIDRAVECTQDR